MNENEIKKPSIDGLKKAQESFKKIIEKKPSEELLKGIGFISLDKPSEIISIWDNRGTDKETLDCMTFVIDEDFDGTGKLKTCLGTSYNGVSFSQFSSCQEGEHLGKKVEWNSLSKEIKQHVINRLSE